MIFELCISGSLAIVPDHGALSFCWVTLTNFVVMIYFNLIIYYYVIFGCYFEIAFFSPRDKNNE